MSFFKNIARVFGFGDRENEIDDLTSDDSEEIQDNLQAKVQVADSVADEMSAPRISDEMKSKIFESVLAVFNEALPEFLQKSIDPEAQQKALLEKINSSLDGYLDNLNVQAERFAENKLRTETDNVKVEADKLKNQMEKLEKQRDNFREQQLSADRRRRALADRVSDLETQLATAEAEREQFELENKSLLNKIKVAEVQPGLVEEMSREIERLKTEIENASKGSDNALEAARASQLKQLNEELAKCKENLAQTELKVAEAEKKIAEAEAAKDLACSDAHQWKESALQLQNDLEELKQGNLISSELYSGLQNELVAERESKEAVEAELAEAKGIYDTVLTLQSQMEQVEDIIKKRDERISKLKTANKKLKDELAQIKALSVDNGLFSMAEEPAAVYSKNAPADQSDNLDEDFELPDWFCASNDPEYDATIKSEHIDFGYQEPPKKPRPPENDAQLSLF